MEASSPKNCIIFKSYIFKHNHCVLFEQIDYSKYSSCFGGCKLESLVKSGNQRYFIIWRIWSGYLSMSTLPWRWCALPVTTNEERGHAVRSPDCMNGRVAGHTQRARPQQLAHTRAQPRSLFSKYCFRISRITRNLVTFKHKFSFLDREIVI